MPESAAKTSISERSPAKLAIDEIRGALLETLLDHVSPLSRKAVGGDGGVELFFRRTHHGLNETVDGLAFCLRHRGERLTVAKPLAERVLGLSEIGRCSSQPCVVAEVPRPSIATKPPEAAQKRHCSGLDPLLELRALLFGELAGVNCLLNAILQRLLERVFEGARLDSQHSGSVVDDCLAILVRSEHTGSGNRGGGAESDREHECHDRAGNEFVLVCLSMPEDETRGV